MPDVFDDEKAAWTNERDELRDLLDEDAYEAARRTTINAHYTDPGYVRAVWHALDGLGFDGGRVLEPGAGAGTFIGLAPENAEMLGVELDPTTAAIARGLYPQARIRTESFATTPLPAEHVDATVGNVPFGDIVLHDPAHNAGRHSMHNHFIIKSLALTRPGGLVAVLTSHYTLDAQNPAARREMSQMADLVGAVRLPTGAHRRSAGTEAVTDLLVLRRREPGAEPRDTSWETVTPRMIDGTNTPVNTYFDSQPENILGKLTLKQGLYGAFSLHVASDDLAGVEAQLRGALERIVTSAHERGLVMTARSAESTAERETFVESDTELWDGTLVATDAGIMQINGGRREPVKVAAKNQRELASLLAMRDSVTELLEMEAADATDTAEITAARAELHEQYGAYVSRYGAINRFTLSKTESRITPEAPRILRRDPFGPAVLALEIFDDETQTARPAAILERRVVTPRPQREGADTPAEAIAISRDRTGKADLPTIAYLLGTDETEARRQLGTLVYDDPVDGQIVPASEYLSGNVRTKLDAAVVAANDDPERYGMNVTALEAVQPEPVAQDQIEAQIGAVWIDVETQQEFFREILRDPSFTIENPLPSVYKVTGNRRTLQASEEWGTEDRSAPELAKSLLSQSEIKVVDEIESGDTTVRVVNAEKTTAAQEKAQKIQERFSEWVSEDAERAERLTDEYNRRFNAIVLRSYDRDGDHLTLPGLVETFTPREHQRAAVARIVSEPAVGLFHQVGAGKTASMVMGAMELKRMGLARKPVVVVPNHMLEQFGREWLQLYPQARILAASSKDLAKDDRRLFVARAAANDWDAIVMTQTAFQSIGLSADFEQRYVQGEVEVMRESLELAKKADERSFTVKQMEKAIARLEEKYKKLVDVSRDPGLAFESTGIDYVMVDEAHLYKNLATASNIPGAALDGSQKSADMHMKLTYLREQHGERVVTMATATPIANSVTEAYVMQRYLRPDLLEDAGLKVFDQWAATFGKTVSEIEVAPTGGENFRMKTRFASFQNVPEMLRMWHVSADVKTSEDLDLPVPDIAVREDGQRGPQIRMVSPGPALSEYIDEIAERADAIANKEVTPDVDNMLKISGDGRKAALDVRMVGLAKDPGGGKLDDAAETILKTWRATRDREYLDQTTGDVSPVPGGLQLVFSDLGVPHADGRWNVYDELKDLLVDGGMDPDSIRFMTEARNDTDKARLFAAARSGHVAVLIGSTERMGVGTNVQNRAVALHHLDAPWRPADVEQRDGRVVRQGNQNEEVSIFRHVVERSFESYMWQGLERKGRFINQLMRGKLDVREMEDVSASTISAAETKAIASGNPLLLEQAQTNDELGKLERLSRAHSRAQTNLIQTHRSKMRRTEVLAERIVDLERAAPSVIDTSGESFRMGVGDVMHDKRSDAASAVGQLLIRSGVQYARRDQRIADVAKVGAHTIQARLLVSGGQADVEFSIDGLPDVTRRVTRERALEGGIGLVSQLENLQASIPSALTRLRQEKAEAERDATDAEARIGRPFEHADRLTEVRAHAEDIARQLKARANGQANPSSSGDTVPEEEPADLAREIQEDDWWAGRTHGELTQLLDQARTKRGAHPAWEDVQAALETGLRKRLPERVLKTAFDLEPDAEQRSRAVTREDTGPVADGSRAYTGPAIG